MEAARREQPVGHGLRLHVREGVRLKPADQHLAVACQQVVEQGRAVVALVPQHALEGVAQQARLVPHAPRQFGGIGGRGRAGREERIQQRPHDAFAVALTHERAVPLEAPQPRLFPQFPVGVPAELTLVGQDEVGQGVAVAPQLLALLLGLEVRADVLALDVADGDAVALDDEVGRAVGRVRGLVDGVRTVAAQRLQQRLHRRAVAVLGGLAAGAFPFQRLAVFAQGLHRTPHDNAPCPVRARCA